MSAIELSFTNGSLDGEGGFTTMRRPVDWPRFPRIGDLGELAISQRACLVTVVCRDLDGSSEGCPEKRSADAYLRFLSRFSGGRRRHPSSTFYWRMRPASRGGMSASSLTKNPSSRFSRAIPGPSGVSTRLPAWMLAASRLGALPALTLVLLHPGSFSLGVLPALTLVLLDSALLHPQSSPPSCPPVWVNVAVWYLFVRWDAKFCCCDRLSKACTACPGQFDMRA